MSKNYSNFQDLLAFLHRKRKECPSKVTLKLQANKYLLLQFVNPSTGKKTTRKAGVDLTEEGIIFAVSKAHKVKQALDTIKTASEFWEWYDIEILGKNAIAQDLRTYREIFSEIESEYFSGVHKNTKRRRDRDRISDQNGFVA